VGARAVVTLAGTWDKRALTSVQALVEKAIAEGWGVQRFREAAAEVVTRFSSGSYADLVYRVSTSQAEAAGRYSRFFSPERIDAIPCWRFVAVRDSRNDDDDECPDMICRKLHGKVFAKADATARNLLPPLHFNCRCFAVQVTDGERKRRKLTVSIGSRMGVRPPEGWDYDKLALVPNLFGG
jgi:SPP1 gp7 family putative phage head morphogenesis protein